MPGIELAAIDGGKMGLSVTPDHQAGRVMGRVGVFATL